MLRLSFGPETTEGDIDALYEALLRHKKYEIFHAVRDTMLQCLKREPGFYRYLWGLTGPIALQNLITFTLGLMDTLMVSWLGNTQMAAVTTANVPVFLLISIVFGVQSGLSIFGEPVLGQAGYGAHQPCHRRGGHAGYRPDGGAGGGAVPVAGGDHGSAVQQP